ncbi:MAG: S9 family peptidase [Schleiferiaceae bacterium]|nr:S9 family peptidase [Schleiferiaceae bacterium]
MHKRLSLYFALLLAFPLFITAQTVMSPELLWQLGRVSLDAVSPDGKQVLYGVTHYDIGENKGSRALYVMDLETQTPNLLLDVPSSLSGGQYFPDGKRIGFLMDGQFYSVATNGADLQQHTDIAGGIFAAKVMGSKDGLRLLFGKKVKAFENTADKYPGLPKANAFVIDDLMYRHWDHWSDEFVNHLCIATLPLMGMTSAYTDLNEGEPYHTPQVPFGGSADYDFHNNKVVYSSKKLTGKDYATSTNTEVYLHDLTSATVTNLSEGLPGYDQHPVFSPDGKFVAWNSMATPGFESDVNDIILYDLKTKKRYHVLKELGRYKDLTFNNVQWGKDAKTLYASVPIDGTVQLVKISIRQFNSKGFNATLTFETEGQYNFGSFGLAGNQLIAERQDMNNATELFLVDGISKSGTQLTNVNTGIYQRIGKSKIEKRMVPTSDGKEMLTWVIYPPDFDATKKYPALLYCQGGPQSQVSQFYSFRWNFQLMAAAGYIVVAPNRRGLPGFGEEWNAAISGDWGGQPMRDYLAAIDHVAAEPFVDENSLGAVGASYGGYSVYLLAGIHENRFKALISHCGLFNMDSWYGTTEELFFANHDIGGPYWETPLPKAYTEYNPIKYVDQWTAPILVIHGGKDFRVPENQGMEAFQAAQLRNIPSKFLYFPEEGHWVLKPQNGLIWHHEFFSWLDGWLK